MSFDINWENLTSDNSLNEIIQDFLHQQFQKIELPSFISNLKVSEFNLGDIPPEIIIRHISDPFEEFYEEDKEEDEEHQEHVTERNEGDDEEEDDDDEEEEDTRLQSTSLSATPPFLRSHDSFHPSYNNIIGLGPPSGTGSDTPTTILNPNLRAPPKFSFKRKPPPQNKGENDLQMIMEINYKGNVYINLLVNLLVNYPAKNFITLPIKLHITDLTIHAISVLAYVKKNVYWSFLCDVTELSNPQDYFVNQLGGGNLQRTDSNRSNLGSNFVDYYTNSESNLNKERIDIIKKIKIESEIGEIEQNVLRNVGKVEKFLAEKIRNILREEMAWPSWICFDLNEQEEEEEE
ncbi:Mitochondrial distribution and morphology protein 12 [Spathaspora sp. JA1]|nr:Mitochondrial distribution and morphology protein 12 [Spathaspora sp. JA1]